MVFSLLEKNEKNPNNLLIYQYDFLSNQFTNNNNINDFNKYGCQAVVIDNNNNNNNTQQQQKQKDLIAFGGGYPDTDAVNSCYININNNNNNNLNQQQQQEQKLQWKQLRSRMPRALTDFAAVHLIDTNNNNYNNHNDNNNYVYLYGGYNYDKGGVQNGCYKYDVTNDTYTIMPPMKTKRYELAKAVFKSKLLFAIGGSDERHNALDTLECLDLSKINNNHKEEWQTLKVKMNKKRGGCCSKIINDILYVIGGIDENGNILNSIEMFDLSKINDDNNKFILLNVTMQTARAYATTLVLGYYVLIIGGEDENGKDLNTIEFFNTKTLQFETNNNKNDNSNSSFPTLSIGRSSCDAFLLHDKDNMINAIDATHGKICVIGGGGSNGTTETIEIQKNVIPISKFQFFQSKHNKDLDFSDIIKKILSYL